MPKGIGEFILRKLRICSRKLIPVDCEKKNLFQNHLPSQLTIQLELVLWYHKGNLLPYSGLFCRTLGHIIIFDSPVINKLDYRPF